MTGAKAKSIAAARPVSDDAIEGTSETRAFAREPFRLSHRLGRWQGSLQLAPALLLLAIFFLVPLARAVWGSFGGSALDFSRYAEIFTDGLYFGVLSRTFMISTVVTGLCIALGYPIAYAMTTLGRRGAALLSLLMLVPLFTAFLIRTYGWMVMLGRNGVVNRLLLALGIVDSPVRILGTRTAVYIGMVHVLMPIAVFTMYASMARLDRTLMTAAQVLGATPVRAFTRIYLPLSMPGVISAAVLVFIMATGFFIAPALLGGPGDTMISQLIMTQIMTLLDLKSGYALSVILLLVTLAVVALASLFVPIEQMWALRPSVAERARAGRAAGRRAFLAPLTVVLGGFERLAHLLVGHPPSLVPTLLRAYVTLAVGFLLAPLVVVYVLSFSSSPFLVFPPPGFSWQWYEKFFASAEWRSALLMSLGLATAVASLSVVVGSAGAFGLVRGLFPGKRLAFLLLIAPLLVPIIVVALSLYVSMADLGLLGDFSGLLIGHLVVAIPYVVIILVSGIRGLDRTLEHAAATLGAAPAAVLRKIVLPTLTPALATAWVVSFLHSFDELLVTLFLLGRQTPTLPIKMWSDIRIQIDPVISAASSVVVTAVALIILATQIRNLLPASRAKPGAASGSSRVAP
jgi:putative spermidine/putrescine transport system permease protein